MLGRVREKKKRKEIRLGAFDYSTIFMTDHDREKKRTYSNKARATYFFDREMDKKEKEEIIRNLYWDYDIVPADVLKLIEHPDEGDEARLRRFFIRAFENLRWHELVSLFGIDTESQMA